MNLVRAHLLEPVTVVIRLRMNTSRNVYLSLSSVLRSAIEGEYLFGNKEGAPLLRH